ncbi:hypothetical protein V6N13_104296 [Hibiscus sabdariffa]|uniref:Uncharacterized protein n=1 Tax=Hibiscus sabdariffa TaxID=183260 RepID=A0ABR2DI74_9ROSI
MARMKHISKATHRNPLSSAWHEVLTSSTSSTLSSSSGVPPHSSSKSPSASSSDSKTFQNNVAERKFHKFQHCYLMSEQGFHFTESNQAEFDAETVVVIAKHN